MNSFKYHLPTSQSQNLFPAIYMMTESQKDYQGLYVASHN